MGLVVAEGIRALLNATGRKRPAVGRTRVEATHHSGGHGRWHVRDDRFVDRAGLEGEQGEAACGVARHRHRPWRPQPQAALFGLVMYGRQRSCFWWPASAMLVVGPSRHSGGDSVPDERRLSRRHCALIGVTLLGPIIAKPVASLLGRSNGSGGLSLSSEVS